VAELHRLRERKEALLRLGEIRRYAPSTFVIHYSCESFYDIPDGRAPRVTSIAVRNLATAQTNSFSIHKLAEQGHVPFADIPQQYDRLEQQMLAEYFDFLQKHSGYTYIHWNMRDINYGFPAIEHRYKVLGGNPYSIPDKDKFDLARVLVALYSRSYAGHGKAGRFLNICDFNKITDKDALNGKEEADAFENQQYVRLHQSTLRKVDMMANLFERAEDGSLKTQAKWSEIYGLSAETVINYIKGHWIVTLTGLVATIAGIVAKISGLF
jgi:hypothetical protein